MLPSAQGLSSWPPSLWLATLFPKLKFSYNYENNKTGETREISKPKWDLPILLSLWDKQCGLWGTWPISKRWSVPGWHLLTLYPISQSNGEHRSYYLILLPISVERTNHSAFNEGKLIYTGQCNHLTLPRTWLWYLHVEPVGFNERKSLSFYSTLLLWNHFPKSKFLRETVPPAPSPVS